MKARLALGYPVLVAAEGPVVLGYGTFGDFRAFPGYRYSVEHSVYIHVDHRWPRPWPASSSMSWWLRRTRWASTS